jgi:ribose transport system ATP-binding protein
VSLTVNPGEILALVGENGAGKSTLMNILSGVYPTSSCSGQIFWQGQRIQFETPAEAKAAGISIIHQELSAFPHLSVAENMVVGDWPQKHGIVNNQEMDQKAQVWLQKIGAHVTCSAPMSALSAGQQQMVEIAKALAQNSKLLILDEPTSSLTSSEAESLFQVLQDLRKSGHGIIYISHRLEEIFTLCDRVTVLRDGESVFAGSLQELQEPDLIKHMVGRTLDRLFPDRKARAAAPNFEPRLKVINVLCHKKRIGPVSFSIQPQEIVGFAGLLGSGRTEIAHAILGDRDSGEVLLSGKLQKAKGGAAFVRESLHQGLAMVPEDRKRESLLPGRSLEENRGITGLAAGPLRRLLSLSKERVRAGFELAKLHTKYRGLEQSINELSGGNQQKVILSRFLQMNPSLIILDEPTRGVDVGARFEIYQLLFEVANQGQSLLVISSDLQELMGLCDRIIVISEGQISGELNRADFSSEAIMSLALKSPSKKREFHAH